MGIPSFSTTIASAAPRVQAKAASRAGHPVGLQIAPFQLLVQLSPRDPQTASSSCHSGPSPAFKRKPGDGFSRPNPRSGK